MEQWHHERYICRWENICVCHYLTHYYDHRPSPKIQSRFFLSLTEIPNIVILFREQRKTEQTYKSLFRCRNRYWCSLYAPVKCKCIFGRAEQPSHVYCLRLAWRINILMHDSSLVCAVIALSNLARIISFSYENQMENWIVRMVILCSFNRLRSRLFDFIEWCSASEHLLRSLWLSSIESSLYSIKENFNGIGNNAHSTIFSSSLSQSLFWSQ